LGQALLDAAGQEVEGAGGKKRSQHGGLARIANAVAAIANRLPTSAVLEQRASKWMAFNQVIGARHVACSVTRGVWCVTRGVANRLPTSAVLEQRASKWMAFNQVIRA
jgi:hypothetical protein